MHTGSGLRGKLKGSLGGSYLLSLAGDGAQSAFHFALNCVLMRVFAPVEYGVFAILFLLGAVAVLFSNALFGVPAKIYIPQSTPAAAKVLEVGLGSATLVSCAGLALLVACGGGLWWGRPVEAAAVGAFVGLWALRSYTRGVVLARSGSGGAAAVAASDLAYTLTGAGLFLAQVVLGAPPLDLTGVFAVLGSANLIGIAVSLAGRPAVRIRFRVRALKRFSRLWRSSTWSLAGVAAASLQGLSLMALVTAWAGPAAYAPIAAGLTVVSPIRIAATAMTGVLLSDLSHSKAKGDWNTVESGMSFTLRCLLAFCLLYGGTLLLVWPLLRQALYDKNFAGDPMGVIVGLSWLAALLASLYSPLVALAQAMLRLRDGAVCIFVGSVVGFGCTLALLAGFGPAFATAGIAAGEAVILVALWITQVRAGPVRPCEAAPLGGRLPGTDAR